MNDLPISGILIFYTFILVGVAFISVYYRRKYEELKEFIKFMSEEKLW